MIPIYQDTKIYIVCPPQTFTGGPELLHQLAARLILMGFKAFMFYYPVENNPVHPYLLEYSNPFVTEVEDREHNLLIIPENLAMRDWMFNDIRKCIWWLSVDNFFKPYITRKDFRLFQLLGLNRLYKKIVVHWKIGERFHFHLVQSCYAQAFLKQHGIQSGYLSDYLNAKFLQGPPVDIDNKVPQVLYNPKKGNDFTQMIIASAMDIKWIPLINMSPETVAALLRQSMVYIDFGNHPGKDRFPREAALLMCCIITGKKGSAAYYDDVPIPDYYKVADSEAEIPQILEKIRSCLAETKKHLKDFGHYRECIISEETRFMFDIERIFIRY